MKRLLATIVLLIALSSPHVAKAETGIDHLHALADVHCQRLADALGADGLSVADLAHLADMNCQQAGDRWISSLFWGA